jgi:hypothetical protein
LQIAVAPAGAAGAGFGVGLGLDLGLGLAARSLRRAGVFFVEVIPVGLAPPIVGESVTEALLVGESVIGAVSAAEGTP